MNQIERLNNLLSQFSNVRGQMCERRIIRSFNFEGCRNCQMGCRNCQMYQYDGFHIKKNIYYSILIRVFRSKSDLSAQAIKAVSSHIFITEISVVKANLRDVGVQIIASAPWKFIKELKLPNNGITQAGIKVIVQCDWKFLSLLTLSQNKIGNKGIHWLAKGCWRQLKFLYLQQCGLTTCSMRYFSKGLLKSLKYLNLQDNLISLQGLRYLISPNTLSLRTLQWSQSTKYIKSFAKMAKIPNPLLSIKIGPQLLRIHQYGEQAGTSEQQ